MKIKCLKCGKTVGKKVGDYKYRESGLDNVILKTIPIYECSCGVSYPSIFRVPRLNDLIAKTLVEKPALLNGKEIKFLRKNIYLSSKAFSKRLGIDKTSLSKWENGIQQHSQTNDRLIRATYMILKGIRHREAMKVFESLPVKQPRKLDIDQDIIIAERIENDYVVSRKLTLESQAEHCAIIWVSSYGFSYTIPRPQASVVNQSETRSNLVCFSSELQETRSSQHRLSL